MITYKIMPFKNGSRAGNGRESQIVNGMVHRAQSVEQGAANRKSQIANRKSNLAWSSKGFTAIELIVVITVLSILTITMLVKNPFNIKDYSSIAADQLIADIQYAQIRAMGARNTQTVTFFVDSGDYGKYNVAGAQKKLPGDITITSTSLTNPLTFNSLGEPGSNGTIDLAGGKAIGGQTVRVYTSTGKAEIE